MRSHSSVDTQALMATAKAAQIRVTARQLELWRYRGLLPRPVRQPGGRAVWLYPPGTEQQLLRLLHWRERTPSLEHVRLGLWIEGFPIDLGGVRGALLTFVDAWTRLLAKESPSDGEDVAAAVDALARKMAGMRGGATVPRVVRMTAPERTRAYGYLISAMFGLKDELARRRDDAVLLERLLGLRSGQGGGLASALAFDDISDRLARMPTPEEAKAVIVKATDEEFELVRRIVQMTTIWMPLLLPLLLTEQGAKARPFVVLAQEFLKDVPPGFYPFLVSVLLVSAHSQELGQEELLAHVTALAPGPMDVELLRELPVGSRKAAFDALPDGRKARVRAALPASPTSPT